MIIMDLINTVAPYIFATSLIAFAYYFLSLQTGSEESIRQNYPETWGMSWIGYLGDGKNMMIGCSCSVNQDDEITEAWINEFAEIEIDGYSVTLSQPRRLRDYILRRHNQIVFYESPVLAAAAREALVRKSFSSTK